MGSSWGPAPVGTPLAAGRPPDAGAAVPITVWSRSGRAATTGRRHRHGGGACRARARPPAPGTAHPPFRETPSAGAALPISVHRGPTVVGRRGRQPARNRFAAEVPPGPPGRPGGVRRARRASAGAAPGRDRPRRTLPPRRPGRVTSGCGAPDALPLVGRTTVDQRRMRCPVRSTGPSGWLSVGWLKSEPWVIRGRASAAMPGNCADTPAAARRRPPCPPVGPRWPWLESCGVKIVSGSLDAFPTGGTASRRFPAGNPEPVGRPVTPNVPRLRGARNNPRGTSATGPMWTPLVAGDEPALAATTPRATPAYHGRSPPARK